jgi:hypothetical protein
MSVWAVTMVRDEADVIGTVVEHMLGQVDHVIVADNMSRDETRAILNGLAAGCDRLAVVDDLDPAYEQSRKMTTLANLAREGGAEWVIPFDADEIWRTASGARIADCLPPVDRPTVAPAAIVNHWATGDDDPAEPDPIRRLRWRDAQPARLHKVAVSTHEGLTVEMGNHQATYGGHVPAALWGLLEVHHFPYRSPGQMVRKATQGAEALRLTDLPDEVGAHWRNYADLVAEHGPAALGQWWREHFYYADPAAAGLVFDPIT